MSTSVNTLLSRADTDSVTTLTLNHPPANTLTPELLVELEGAFAGLARDATVKAVVLTGAGRFFVAGAEIRVLAGIASSKDGMEMALRRSEERRVGKEWRASREAGLSQR